MPPAVTMRFSPAITSVAAPTTRFGIDAVHRVRVSGFSDFHDAAIFDADVGFHDSPVIENHGIGDDEIERARF